MKIHSKAVHSGDRKRTGGIVPSTVPIHTASSYFYSSAEKLDRIFGNEEEGFCYSRYGNPTTAALEELIAELESGHGALACSSGMMAVQMALTVALTDRSRSILASNALYGATIQMLLTVFGASDVEVRFLDFSDLELLERTIAEDRPGCVLFETISNPLLRVPAMDRIIAAAREAGSCVVVDSTFATPLLVRPLELGANLVVHSATKYLAGHGDVLGGLVVSDEAHFATLRNLGKICGPVLGPFDAYLTMRGMKTFPLRMERQCQNACRLASWLAAHPRVEKVHYPADPAHPDAAIIRRLLPDNLYGGIVSFEIAGAGQNEVFAFLDALQMVVPGTTLGDVHSLILYPVMSSHRDVSPRQRERMGIKPNLLRLSAGIEAVEDIQADLEQALAASASARG